ncbi:LacI family DNA-binding transcriptional regulator [[Erwinia] mediterraneensis]|uniref:LacI family DNA-binding transcriptional regulator n=1 Tax=[Erwinia] mediterraneensis TaxID=2161819 RepID=UPI0010325806|nr:LacI family DNA-binding transcriptional regulator [[Erwinia] mediterraneensis]
MSLKVIARTLGISVTTVSRALNGYDDVASATRKRIEEEASRRGYRPHAAARRLKTGRANAVGLVFPVNTTPLNNSLFSKTLVALDQQLARQEIDLLLLADKPHDNQRALLRMLHSRALDAVIFTRPRPQDPRLMLVQQKGFPFLTLGRSELPQPYAWFDFDNHAGPRLAVHYCLDRSISPIAWLGSNDTYTFVRDRRQGYLDALTQRNILPDARFVAAVRPSRRAGYQQTLSWLASPQPPRAIITDCSELGEGAATALQQTSRLQGEQAVTLIIYDGLPVDSIVNEPLPAIIQSTQRDPGERVAQMMLDLLAGRSVGQLQELWQPELRLPDRP